VYGRHWPPVVQPFQSKRHIPVILFCLFCSQAFRELRKFGHFAASDEFGAWCSLKGNPMTEKKDEKKPQVCTLCGKNPQYPICDDCCAKEQRRALVRKEKEEHHAA
jgi:hypothetical protein